MSYVNKCFGLVWFLNIFNNWRLPRRAFALLAMTVKETIVLREMTVKGTIVLREMTVKGTIVLREMTVKGGL